MKANHKGTIPFVLLLIPYLIGIAAGINLSVLPGNSSLLLFLTALIVVFVILNFLYGKVVYKAKWVGGSLTAVILVIAGIFNVGQNNELRDTTHFSKATAQNLIVKITDEPVWKNNSLRFTAVAEEAITNHTRQETSGKLLVTIKSEAARSLRYGNVLLISAKYYEVDPPFNPAEFNYKGYLANKNIYHQAYLYPGQYMVLAHNSGNPVIAYALRLRQTLVNKLKANIRNPDAAAVASTLILGYKAELSSEVLQAYSKTGTIHVLSVSGAHVGLVYLVLTFLLGFLNRCKHGRVIRAVIIISLVWFYALLTGFSPPVCRAAVMLSLIITGKTYNRYINSLNILAFSAFMLLLFDPLLLTDVGFQLSYLAVAGLIILQPIIYRQIVIKNKWLDKLWIMCSASIAAQVITLPLSAYYFHQVPVYFLVSNLFILVPSALMMCGGILYLFLPETFILSKWLGYGLEQLIIFTNKTLGYIEHAPLSSINKVWLTPAEYLLLYGIIVCAFVYAVKPHRFVAGLGIGLTVLCCISVIIKKTKAADTKQTVFLNLRKNTGIVFRNGDKAVVVTDVQVNSKTFTYSVQPYLDSSKVSEVNIIGLDSSANTAYLYKKGGLVKFAGQFVMFVNKRMPAKAITPDKAFVYITGNPIIDSAYLKLNFKNKTLIIGGNNSKRYTTKLAQQAKLLNINYKILYGNHALVITSK
ncbi:MAG: ComEC family competence protein [Sphingobacteriaceae bacterium]|nr:MAG: ComEC family competence protein [Sphingobacteriaceae bacterium]